MKIATISGTCLLDQRATTGRLIGGVMKNRNWSGRLLNRSVRTDSLVSPSNCEGKMLGRKERDQLRFFVRGSLRDLLPGDHVLVRVDRVLDLSWLSSEVAGQKKTRPIFQRKSPIPRCAQVFQAGWPRVIGRPACASARSFIPHHRNPTMTTPYGDQSLEIPRRSAALMGSNFDA
jgi:hypothetical protein